MESNALKSFCSARDFLVDSLRERQRKNPRFSLRAWSRQLGYRNPSLLSDVLRGKRPVSEEMLHKLIINLGLDEESERDFRMLTQQMSASKPLQNGLAEQRKTRNPNTIELDKFRLVSDWYHIAILEFFLLKNFVADAKSIAAMFRRRISRALVETTLERLFRLNLIEKNASGKLQRSKLALDLFVGRGIPNVAIRRHHQQLLELATEALEKQDVSERDFSGSFVAIKKRDLPKVREAIYQLHSLFNDLSASSGDGDAVYRLSVQLFRLDKDVKEVKT